MIKIPPIRVIQLSILVKNPGSTIKLKAEFIKYNPKMRYTKKYIKAPFFFIVKINKHHI